jgi:hypothetical protein
VTASQNPTDCCSTRSVRSARVGPPNVGLRSPFVLIQRTSLLFYEPFRYRKVTKIEGGPGARRASKGASARPAAATGSSEHGTALESIHMQTMFGSDQLSRGFSSAPAPKLASAFISRRL